MKYIAFLRAINVGGHTVKMDNLRQLFESLGFRGVATFIASGNVVFEASTHDLQQLENMIEGRLNEALGYEVATFIRTPAELASIASYQPFPVSLFAAAITFNVALLKDTLDEEQEQKLMNRKTDIDDFRVNGREVFWLCRTKQSESTFSNAVLEKTIGRPSTLRGMSTLKKMAEKYPPSNIVPDQE
jgi:uncharacterized protein (DUF1697 family)